MPRKNTQRPIDVVKTSVWDVVGTTSLRRCEDVSFNTRRTDQFETYWRRPWDVVCLLGKPWICQCFTNIYVWSGNYETINIFLLKHKHNWEKMAPKNNQAVNSMTVSDLRKIIHEEFEKAFKTQVDERLSKMEESIKQIGNLHATIDSMEVALSNTSQRFDDLEKVTSCFSQSYWAHHWSRYIPITGSRRPPS